VTDNLFDRLADLLRSPGPVNWRLAREIAESVAGAPEPIEPDLADEYRELAETAARLIERATTLTAATITEPVGIHDPRSWAAADVETLAYVAEPLGEKLSSGAGAGSPLAMLGPALLGMQVGSAVGFMSHRVLGRFDAGMPPGTPVGVAFVVPNIEAFAADHGLDPRQLRLWVALQELAHRAVLSIPWVDERIHMLVHEHVEALDLDPEALQRRFEALQDPEELERLMESSAGLGAIFRSDAPPEAHDRLRALLALIDGYAETIVTSAGSPLIPELDRVREAVDRHRAEPAEGGTMIQDMIGLTIDPADYRRGVDFVSEVERRWGPEALERAWEGPESAPTLSELADPVGWAARVLL
jgi:putative hydrolase